MPGILRSLLGERRASDYSLRDLISDVLQGLGAWTTDTGIKLDEIRAMNYGPVFACARVLAETVGQVPLHLYERLDEGGKRRATDHYLYPVLHDQVNERMTPQQFKETLTGHIAVWGDGFAEKELDGAGRLLGLWPWRPDRTEIKSINGELWYQYTMSTGEKVILSRERMFHIPGFGFDGIGGYSIISLARQGIGLGLAMEQHGSTYFKNDARPSLVITKSGGFTPEAEARFLEGWDKRHQGLTKNQRIAILEEGMDIKEVSFNPRDSQFLESREYQVEDTCGWFRMQPHMIMRLKRATNNNIEEQALEFVNYTMMPWFVRWEQQVTLQLLLPADRKRYFAEFLVDGLLRGSSKNRNEAYSIGRQGGWLNADEIREMQNMNPIPGGWGKIYLVPLNMIPADQVGQGLGPDEPPPAGDGDAEPGGPSNVARALVAIHRRSDDRRQRLALLRRRQAKSYRLLFADYVGRCVRREKADVLRYVRAAFGQRDWSSVSQWLSDFYREHEGFVAKTMTPVYRAYAEVIQGQVAEEVNAQEGLTSGMELFVDSYAAGYAKRHAGWSINRLRAAAADKPSEAETLAALEEEFDSWETSRPAHVAASESVRAGNAFAREAYIVAGVAVLEWVCGPKACEFCLMMDGRTMGVQQPFLHTGDALQPGVGAASFDVTGNVSHPPLHDGCECMVVASIA